MNLLPWNLAFKRPGKDARLSWPSGSFVQADVSSVACVCEWSGGAVQVRHVD